MLRRQLGKLIRWCLDEPEDEPVYKHPVFSKLNSVFLEILADPSCRSGYAWGVLQGAYLARALGIPRVSVVEFGVAGGNGLVALENIADRVEKALGTQIEVYGFDTGSGLPPPRDYRDLPHFMSDGMFPMDIDKLRSRLRRAHLLLGSVEQTLPEFTRSLPAPVSFVSFDLDFYSSTKAALGIFEADQKLLLPRVHCRFDDIFVCGDHEGERLAIAEFNASHAVRKVSRMYGLNSFVPRRVAGQMEWEKYYMAYIFDHELYPRKQLQPEDLPL